VDSGSLAGKRAKRASNVSQENATRRAARPDPSRRKERLLRMTNCYSLVPVARPPHAGKAVAQSKHRLCTSPSNCPWTRPATHLDGAWIQLFLLERRMNDEYLNRPSCNSVWWGPTEQGRPGKGATLYCFNPAPCGLFYEHACERARLSRVSSRRVSGKRSGA
jgi:hypothetical protein